MNFKLIIIATLSTLAVETAFAADGLVDCMPGVGTPYPKNCTEKCYTGSWGTDYVLDATHTQDNPNVWKFMSKTSEYNSHRFTCSGIKRSVDVILKSYTSDGLVEKGRKDGHKLYSIDDYFDISVWVKLNQNPQYEDLDYGRNEFVDYDLTLRASTDVFKNDVGELWWNWDRYIKVHFPETYFIIYHKKDFLGTRTFNHIIFKTNYYIDGSKTVYPRILYNVYLKGKVTSAQSCVVDGGATIEFNKVSSRALQVANGEPPAGTPAQSGTINISCRYVHVPIKLELHSTTGTINNALVSTERADIGFKIVDENNKPIVPNGQAVAIEGLPTAWNPKIRFKAWPVFFGSSADPAPAPGRVTGRATLNVEFQ